MNRFTLIAGALTLASLSCPVRADDAAARPIAIENAWARATPAGARTGAAYLTIENRGAEADRLTAASSPAAEKVEVHEMSMTGGIMRMRAVAGGLAVPAHGSVTLKPGGYHLMLTGLKHPLKAGETLAVTLTFAKAGAVAVSAPIRPIGGTGAR